MLQTQPTDIPPLVPPEVDLTDFGFMPLEVGRLLSSALWIKARRDPKVAHAAVSLWCECWHQVPAASLPNDDELLADLARCDAGEWERVKEMALRKFVLCSDGRLYHRVVAVKALEAWAAKLAQRARTRKATEARLASGGKKKRATSRQRDVRRDVNVTSTSRDIDVARDVHQGKGREGKGEGEVGSATPKVVGGGASQLAAAARNGAAAGAAATRGSRLPEDWKLPKAWGDWAMEEYPQWGAERVRLEAQRFRNHWVALSGSAATKRDWFATWQNWCLNDIAHRGEQPVSPATQPYEHDDTPGTDPPPAVAARLQQLASRRAG